MILYRCGILWLMWFMLVMVKLILVLWVIVKRCRIVLVELFMVIFSVMVFLKVLKVVMLCGRVDVLLCLY